MFYNTEKFITIIKHDVRTIGLIFGIFNLIATFIYPIFAILVELGNLYVNIAFLSVAIINGIIQLVVDAKTRKATKKIYSWIRILISTVALVLNIYSIYLAATNVNGIAIIISTLMIIFWILKVLFNLIGDVFMTRFNQLKLCLIEDSKPLAQRIYKYGNKYINLDYCHKETPKNVKDLVQKANKYEKVELQKNNLNQIKENYKDLEYKADLDNDGKIDLNELLLTTLELDNILIKKDKFFRDYLGSKSYLENKIDEVIKKGTFKKELNDKTIKEYVNEIILEVQPQVDNFRKCLDGNYISYENQNEFKIILNDFSEILIAMQKIIYIYGLDNIKSKGDITDKHKYAIVLAFSVVMQDCNSGTPLDYLNDISKEYVKSKIGKIANKVGGVLVKNKDLFKAILPHVQTILNFYNLGNLDLFLKPVAAIAKEMIEKNK